MSNIWSSTTSKDAKASAFTGDSTKRWVCLLDIHDPAENIPENQDKNHHQDTKHKQDEHREQHEDNEHDGRLDATAQGATASPKSDNHDTFNFDELEAELLEMVDMPELLPPASGAALNPSSAAFVPAGSMVPYIPTAVAPSNVAIATFAAIHNPAHAREFHPTRMHQQETMGFVHPRTEAHERQLVAIGSSSQYLGDPFRKENQSANIPEYLSCAFWLEGLPPAANCTTVLAAIRNIGRVYCTHLSPPKEGKPTAAMKVVFFELPAAQQFWNLYAGRGRLRVQGYPVRVVRDWTKVPHSLEPNYYTRVVIITGHPSLLDVEAILGFLKTKIVFQMDTILVGDVVGAGSNARQTVELRFSSFRVQAHMAFSLLKGRPGLTVVYGRDPCDRV